MTGRWILLCFFLFVAGFGAGEAAKVAVAYCAGGQ